MSKDYVVPADVCTVCHYEFDRASSMTGKGRVKPGNVSVCLNCGHATLFTEDLMRREISAKEYMAFPDWIKALCVQAQANCSRARGIDLALLKAKKLNS